MKYFDYIFQDLYARYDGHNIVKNLLRYYRLPSCNLLVKYRMCQYFSLMVGGGKPLLFSRLRLERANAKYCTTIDYGLDAGVGLCFPHNGPFVINASSKIGKYCTIHPQVLIGGDRAKGAPVIGDYVFLGNGAKIVGNCKIGDWVFISPGAMITKDIPSNSLVGFGLNNIISSDGKRHVEMYL